MDLQEDGKATAARGARLIALDWGSTSLRAWLMDSEGRILAQRADDEGGASKLQGGATAFEARLRAVTAGWTAGGATLPIVACGMVGSQHGWVEAPYAPCPVALDDLPRHAALVEAGGGQPLRIVPGVSHRHADGAPDVMRGEETQVAGVLARYPGFASDCCVVLPGTHSKWVVVREGRIVSLATHMTGELYALLRAHSVLGRLMAPGTGMDGTAFDEGLRVARRSGGADLARLLFSVRSRGLFGELPATGLADYLSGLLIGSEIAAALAGQATAQPLVLAGEPELCERYRRALAAFGCTPAAVEGNTASDGLWAFASRAGWVSA